MEIKNVICFKTTDGKIFEGKEQAESHQKRIDYYKFLDEKGYDVRMVDPDDLLSFISEFWDELNKYRVKED